jgi:hypothetical protein
MNMKRIITTLKLSAVVVLLGSAIVSSGPGSPTTAPFEGTIEFTKTIGPVTSKYVYYVKNEKVRVEELGEDGNIQGIMLVNTVKNSVVALSPERKMFIEVPNAKPNNDSNLKIDKTKNTKNIKGYDCNEWKVTCSEDGREVSYWVAKDNFNFFIPLLKTLNRKDKIALYFIEIPENIGVFPLVGYEKKTNGVELSRLEVNKVNKAVLKETMFEIPAGFSKFERE